MEANGLQLFLEGGGKRTESYQLTVDATGHASSSVAENLQAGRVAWISSKIRRPNAPVDSAFNTGILLVSSAVSLFSCFFLADPVPSRSTGGWLSRPAMGYIVAPLVIGFAQHAAAWLHACAQGTEQSVGESMCAATASSTCIVGLVLPLCVMASWPTGTESALLFDVFQGWFLAVSALLPTLLIRHRSDDWYKSSPTPFLG
jgi:Ca2+/H+ antiporter